MRTLRMGYWLAIIITLISSKSFGQNGTLTPNVFKPPHLTYSAILALASPQKGDTVYDLTSKSLRVYDGNDWISIGQTKSNCLISQNKNISSSSTFSNNYKYDALGRVIVSTDSTSTSVSNSTITTYNSIPNNNNGITKTINATNSYGYFIDIYDYDQYGNLSSYNYQRFPNSPTHDHYGSTTYSYNTDGLISQTSISNIYVNVTINLSYDLRQNLISETGTYLYGGSSYVHNYQYDVNDLLLNDTYNSSGGLPYSNTYEYNSQGKRIKTTANYPSLSTTYITTNEYNSKGKVSKTTSSSQISYFYYDLNNNLMRKNIFDTNGNLTSTTIYEYDLNNNASIIQIYDGSGVLTSTQKYTYICK